jgi:hypothetical protein
MSSDNHASDASAGSHGDVHENSTDEDSVTSVSDGLVPSDGSHTAPYQWIPLILIVLWTLSRMAL